MKAVDGEVMKLSQHVLDDLHGPATIGGQKVPASNGGSPDSSHPMPGGIGQEVKLKGGESQTKFPEPGGAQEVHERSTKRGVPLGGA